MRKLLFVAALLFAPAAFAQTYWSPSQGYSGRDGGNDIQPIFPLLIGNHGTASASPYQIGVTTFGASWGTVNNSDTQGTDTDFTINFYSGTGAATTVGATVFTINFGQAWSAATQSVPDGGAAVPMFGGFCYFLGPYTTTGPSLNGLFPLSQTSASTAIVTANIIYTPASTTNFHFGCHVFNLGAAY